MKPKQQQENKLLQLNSGLKKEFLALLSLHWGIFMFLKRSPQKYAHKCLNICALIPHTYELKNICSLLGGFFNFLLIVVLLFLKKDFFFKLSSGVTHL